jgi:hypothetical protein
MLLTDRHAESISGVLSCYDLIVIQGTLPGFCYAEGMTGYLKAQQIRIIIVMPMLLFILLPVSMVCSLFAAFQLLLRRLERPPSSCSCRLPTRHEIGCFANPSLLNTISTYRPSGVSCNASIAPSNLSLTAEE